MEQFNLTNTGLKEEEFSEQELSEQELAKISGGSFLSKLGGVAKGVGRFGRDTAAAYGAVTIISGLIPQKSSAGQQSTGQQSTGQQSTGQ